MIENPKNQPGIEELRKQLLDYFVDYSDDPNFTKAVQEASSQEHIQIIRDSIYKSEELGYEWTPPTIETGESAEVPPPIKKPLGKAAVGAKIEISQEEDVTVESIVNDIIAGKQNWTLEQQQFQLNYPQEIEELLQKKREELEKEDPPRSREDIAKEIGENAVQFLRDIFTGKATIKPADINISAIRQEYEKAPVDANSKPWSEVYKQAGLLELGDAAIKQLSEFFDSISANFENSQENECFKESKASADQIIEDLLNTDTDGYARIIGQDGKRYKMRIIAVKEENLDEAKELTKISERTDTDADQHFDGVGLYSTGGGMPEYLKYGGFISNKEGPDHVQKFNESLQTAITEDRNAFKYLTHNNPAGEFSGDGLKFGSADIDGMHNIDDGKSNQWKVSTADLYSRYNYYRLRQSQNLTEFESPADIAKGTKAALSVERDDLSDNPTEPAPSTENDTDLGSKFISGKIGQAIDQILESFDQEFPKNIRTPAEFVEWINKIGCNIPETDNFKLSAMNNLSSITREVSGLFGKIHDFRSKVWNYNLTLNGNAGEVIQQYLDSRIANEPNLLKTEITSE